MRPYGEFCGLARALDVVGDRWTLLVVRELLIAPARYGELEKALHGIATNLLAARLRSLEEAGVVERRLDDTSGVRYALTAWGEGLRDAIAALIRWSAPLMAEGRGQDAFEPAWLAVALGALLGEIAGDDAKVAVSVEGSLVEIARDQKGTRARIVLPSELDSRTPLLTADPEVVLALAAGRTTPSAAISSGSLRGRSADFADFFGAGEVGVRTRTGVER